MPNAELKGFFIGAVASMGCLLPWEYHMLRKVDALTDQLTQQENTLKEMNVNGGLLRGRAAATHWGTPQSHDKLAADLISIDNRTKLEHREHKKFEEEQRALVAETKKKWEAMETNLKEQAARLEELARKEHALNDLPAGLERLQAEQEHFKETVMHLFGSVSNSQQALTRAVASIGQEDDAEHNNTEEHAMGQGHGRPASGPIASGPV
jgi:hypothetical protein